MATKLPTTFFLSNGGRGLKGNSNSRFQQKKQQEKNVSPEPLPISERFQQSDDESPEIKMAPVDIISHSDLEMSPNSDVSTEVQNDKEDSIPSLNNEFDITFTDQNNSLGYLDSSTSSRKTNEPSTETAYTAEKLSNIQLEDSIDQVEAFIHFEDDTEELQQGDQQIMRRFWPRNLWWKIFVISALCMMCMVIAEKFIGDESLNRSGVAYLEYQELETSDGLVPIGSSFTMSSRQIKINEETATTLPLKTIEDTSQTTTTRPIQTTTTTRPIQTITTDLHVFFAGIGFGGMLLIGALLGRHRRFLGKKYWKILHVIPVVAAACIAFGDWLVNFGGILSFKSYHGQAALLLYLLLGVQMVVGILLRGSFPRMVHRIAGLILVLGSIFCNLQGMFLLGVQADTVGLYGIFLLVTLIITKVLDNVPRSWVIPVEYHDRSRFELEQLPGFKEWDHWE